MAGTNLRVKSIELKNFRSYGDFCMDFSQDQTKSITVIEGGKGAGKTSLINAISWCLYGKENFSKSSDGMPIPNGTALKNTDVGEACESSATITIHDGHGPRYKIMRRLECRRISGDHNKRFCDDAAGEMDSGFITNVSQSFAESDSKGWNVTDTPSGFAQKVAKFLPDETFPLVVIDGVIGGIFFREINYCRIRGMMENASTILRRMNEFADIRHGVQCRTDEIFKTLSAKWPQTNKVVIDTNCKVRFLNIDGTDELERMSASHILGFALSHIVAIREVTDVNYPLIIDSPFGNISQEGKIRMAEEFPKYLPNTQMILLFSDNEYLADNMDYSTGKIVSVRDALRKSKRLGRELTLEVEKRSGSHST